MSSLEKFVEIVKKEFPEERVTYQKGIPTFHPETAPEAGAFFQLANRNRQRLFIAGFGNNINPAGPAFGDIMAIKSDRLNTLLHVAGGDYYITVGGGYPLREINKALLAYNLFLPHADLPYVGSVGGALAVGLTCNYKEHRLPFGRYFIKGEIVDPTGKILTPGSVCFKSVSGFDIIKIFSPSWGMLGMIITATLRVLPVSERYNYENLTMYPVDGGQFAALYRNPGNNVSAQYSLKIKNKFDPNGVLPLIFPA